MYMTGWTVRRSRHCITIKMPTEKECGLPVSDEGNDRLGYEGTHLYKINGKYYLFFIHSLREKWRRVESCFVADSLEGEFTGRDVFNEDTTYRFEAGRPMIRVYTSINSRFILEDFISKLEILYGEK